ncbi:MAG: hypothetical protein Q7S24_01330 [bacterium]|nr:hypothetical protein [bacterium]
MPMINKILRWVLFILVICIVANFYNFPVLAATTSSDFGVSLTVPCYANCGGGGGADPLPVTDTVPVIANVVTTQSVQGANITWSASDDKGIVSVSLVYGLDINYGQSGVVGGSYTSVIAGLTMATKYYYKITVVDTGSNQAVFSGSFTTLTSDATAPIISNIIVTPSFTTAQITFDTNEPATTVVNYGLNNSYGSSIAHAQNLLTSHSYVLSGLLPNTTYHFNIEATDAPQYLNSASSLDQNFKTEIDLSAPPNVANLQLNTTQNSILLTWSNPSANFVPDFAGVKILRKTTGPANGQNDPGAVVKYTGSAENLTDNSVLKNVLYYYTVFSFDTSGNFSAGVSVSGKILSPVEPKVEICGNSIDDDNNGKVDCADTVCAETANCKIPSPPPASPPTSTIPTTPTPVVPIPTTPTVPSFIRIQISDLMFWSGNKKIVLSPNGDSIFGLVGSELMVGIKKTALVSTPKKIILKLGSGEHQFVLSADTYFTDVVFPNVGSNQAYLEVDYGDNQLDSLGFKINGLPLGVVHDSDGALSGAVVSLFRESGQLFDGLTYNQFNPWNTSVDGGYGWMVPNGRYFVVANKSGYYERKTTSVTVTNNIFNQSVELIKEPKNILEIIDPNVGLGKNIKNVSKNLLEKSKAITKLSSQSVVDFATKANELSKDPVVQQTATEVAPVVVGVVAAGTLAAVSWLDLLSLLRFLFLQPLMLLGRKKRIKWGVVYNSLTKLPMDLVIVRLINVESGKLVQSKVTDGQGRYAFVVDSGKYRVEVRKTNFTFPSNLLKDWKTDGDKLDVYHGETIAVMENGSLVTANIPLDPAGENKTPKRLLRERFWGRVQWSVSVFGLVITLLSLYIYPKWYMWALLVVHVVLLFVFRRLAIPKKAKGWGIVYDLTTKKPIGRAVARLFDSHFNKLVAMEVTDKSGRYHFLAGNNKYYATYEHAGYESGKTEVIDLGMTKDDTIVRDIGLISKK